MSHLSVTIVFILVALLPSHILAQDTPVARRAQARQLYERGTLAYEQERWEDCAEKFEASFVLVFAPALLYNIGICYENFSASEDSPRETLTRASRAYTRYIRESPNGPDSDDARMHLALVQERLSALPEVAQPVEESAASLVALPPAVEPPEVPSPVLVVPPLAPRAPLASPRRFRYTLTSVGAGLTVLSSIVSLVYYFRTSAGYNKNPWPPGFRRNRTVFRVSTTLTSLLAASTGMAFWLEFRGVSAVERASISWSHSF